MIRVPTDRTPTHPGEMLVEEFLKPMGLTQRDLADAIHVPYQRINEIVNGKRGITPSTHDLAILRRKESKKRVSLLQRVSCHGQKSERFKFANEKQTIGQRLYSLNREALGNLLSLSENLFIQGQSSQNILELLMPT